MQGMETEETSDRQQLRERMQRRAIENVALSDRSAGERVTALVRDRIADGSERVVVTNANGEVPRELVDHAFEALRYSGLVCAPDEDGAIALLGMTEPLDDLLAGVPWDTSDALEQLLSAARDRNVSVMLLPPAGRALRRE
jgi:glycosyltransferase A (GT-A) superfamily protein (DUF2064 family)